MTMAANSSHMMTQRYLPGGGAVTWIGAGMASDMVQSVPVFLGGSRFFVAGGVGRVACVWLNSRGPNDRAVNLRDSPEDANRLVAGVHPVHAGDRPSGGQGPRPQRAAPSRAVLEQEAHRFHGP